MPIPAPAIDALPSDATATVSARLVARPTLAEAIFAFVVACALGKLFAAWATGFTGDEAYSIVIGRILSLSYFDHPPLHQWMLHGFAALLGETSVRLPFVLMAVEINLTLYGLTRRLFG